MAYTYDQVITALKEADKAGHAEDATRLATIAKSMKQAPAPVQKNYALGDVPSAAISNAGSDVGDIASGFANVVAHPANALQGAIQLGSGALSKILPESIMKYAVPEKRQQAEQVANAEGQNLYNKYGTYENIKRTLAEHPVSALMDVSTVLGGGGALLKGAEEGSKLSKMADILNTGSKYTNPLTAVEKAVPLVTKPVGIIVKNIIGTTTGAGADTVANAFKAGKEGNTAFMENLTGKANMEDVLAQAKSALDNIKKTKSEDYAKNMEAVKSDQSVLDMQPILDSLNAEKTAGKFGDKIIKKNTVKTQTELEGLIHDWASSDPAKYHTPEGLDALKQAVGDLRDSTEFGTNSRRIVDNVYHSIKNQISNLHSIYGNIYAPNAPDHVGVVYNTKWNPPLVHKTNGKGIGMYFAPFQLGKFVELTQEQSDELKQALCDHVLSEKYVYHHDWQDGDVVISDQWNGIHKRWPFNKMNVRVLHRAGVDYTESLDDTI